MVKYKTGNATAYGMDSVENYLLYLDKICSGLDDPHFDEIHKIVNAKMCYQVSKMRAVEVVMFVTR